jgi:putative DNA primase/helicase
MVNFDHIPAALCERDQWLMWMFEARDGKRTKTPWTIDRRRAASTRPETWTSFPMAQSAYRSGAWDGIGYVFAESDPFCGIDIDHATEPNGRITDAALDTILLLNSYTEWTPSGAGFHVLIEGKLPGRGRRHGNVEVYDTGRFFTVTGARFIVTPSGVRPRQEALDHLLSTFPERKPPAQLVALRPPVPDVDALLAQMLRARNSGKVAALLRGDTSGYQSASEAELALCECVAWYDPSPSTLDAVVRRSGLLRDKWDELRGDQTYGALTIATALSMVTPRQREAWSVPLYRV